MNSPTSLRYARRVFLHRQPLDPVTVHVNRVEDPLGEVIFHGRWQLRDQEIQEDRALLPAGVRERQDAGEKGVCAHERLGLALEVHLPVLIQLLKIDGDAGVEDRVELVAIGVAEVALHEVVQLSRRVDLRTVQIRLEVMQP